MSTFCPPTPVETRSILVAKVQVGIRESHESPGPGVGTGDMGGGSLAHDPGIRLAQGHRDRALQHRLLCGWNSSIDGCYLAADSAQVLTSEKAALSASLAQIRVRVALWALTAALTRHGHRDKRRRRTPRQRPRRLCVGSLPSCFKYQSQQCHAAYKVPSHNLRCPRQRPRRLVAVPSLLHWQPGAAGHRLLAHGLARLFSETQDVNDGPGPARNSGRVPQYY